MFLLMNGSGGSRSHVCSRMLRLLYRVVRMLSVAVVWVRLSVVTMFSLCNVSILERWTKYELRVRHGVLHGSLDAVLFPCIWTWRYGVLGTLLSESCGH